jgi:outer membrane beta-barrel protein
MKYRLSLFIFTVALLPASAFAEPAPSSTSLEAELNSLKTPANMPPNGVTHEKLYSVQTRYNPLKGRFGISVGAARNFTGSSYLNMTQLNLDLRYHLSDRWSLVLGGAYGFNSFTSDADRLMSSDGMLPDSAYVKTRAHALGAFNLFYGKFRASMDEVFYFDQYVAVGPGLVMTQFGSAPSGVIDIGFVFWAGRHFDVRLGFQNEFFNEKRIKSSSSERHSLAHLDIGYTFGGAKP